MNNIVDAKHELLLAQTGGGESARLVMALLTTTRQIDAECAVLLSRHDLSEGRFAALLAVSVEPGITHGNLADRLSVTRATVTGLVDGLERRDMIERVADASDRRSQALRITESGERLIAELAPMYAGWLEQIASGVSARERKGVFEALSTVQRNISRGGTR